MLTDVKGTPLKIGDAVYTLDKTLVSKKSHCVEVEMIPAIVVGFSPQRIRVYTKTEGARQDMMYNRLDQMYVFLRRSSQVLKPV